MKALAVAVLLSVLFAQPGIADPVMFHPGSGDPNPLPPDRDAFWSEPPDLNGMLGSSEQILVFGLETEIANDFIARESRVQRATWWGGFWNNSVPCDPGMTTTGFNLEFFRDDGCRPGELIADLSIVQFEEQSLGCQQGYYPLYGYSAYMDVSLIGDARYWFCAQMKDHPFPPQWGRLAARLITDCDSMFRSVYFSYPEWTPCGDGMFWYDASQEFEGISVTTDIPAACCFTNGSCEMASSGQCVAEGGIWQGVGSECAAGLCTQGPCCLSDGSCVMTNESGCPPGQWQGSGSVCASPSCEVRAPGAIAAWGRNDYGQCDVPDPNEHFAAVAGGGFHALGLNRDGAVLAWGRNDHGQCDVPPSATDCIAVTAGWGHSMALRSDGTIVAWGLNENHQCEVPEPDSGFVAIAAGGYHSLGLKRDGSVVAWGMNYYHECDVPEPNVDFQAVAAGGYHSYGLKRDGSIVAWGWNPYHQCDVPAGNGFVTIASGWNHGLALRPDGSITAWGRNNQQQLNVPAPDSGFVAIAGGSGHSLAIRRGGRVVVWGANDYGERNIPAPSSGFVAVAGFGYQSFGLVTSPTIACCLRDGSCSVVTEDECIAAGGTPLRGDVTCESNPCATADAGAPALPLALSLSASPNPSAGRASLVYELPSSTVADLRIYDAAGRVVRRFPLETRAAGRHTVLWDGRDDHGRIMPAGIYPARLTTAAGERTERIVLLGR